MIAPMEQVTGSGLTLGAVEAKAQSYDVAADTLDAMIADLESDLDAVRRKHLKGLKAQAAIVANREAELHAAIDSSHGLFVKPRTFILHGVKVGLTTSNGKLVWDGDDEDLVAAIKRRFKEDEGWRGYIKTTEVPSKDALRLLDAATLAKLGCRIEGAGDVVVLSRTAGDVEKMMKKLVEKMVSAMVEAED